MSDAQGSGRRAATYQVRLVGGDAEFGRVPAADVARLLLGVERAVARAAGAAIGRPVKPTGRWEAVIKRATEFRLVRLRGGSIVAELDLPETTDEEHQLLLKDTRLGQRGWALTIEAASDGDNADLDVQRVLADWADQLGIGTRYEAVELRRKGDRRRVRIDRACRDRLRDAIQRRQRLDTVAAVAGVLVEADFERHTAHVRTPMGELVELQFDDEQEETIYEALRQRSEFEGDVRYDLVTNSIKSVRLRRVIRTEQLIFGEDAGEFWRSVSFSELSERQGTGVISSFDELQDDTLSDEEFAAFLAAVDE
jgi:hypothetical protein